MYRFPGVNNIVNFVGRTKHNDICHESRVVPRPRAIPSAFGLYSCRRRRRTRCARVGRRVESTKILCLLAIKKKKNVKKKNTKIELRRESIRSRLVYRRREGRRRT